MAEVYKILGQSNPSASTETTLYTVPSSTSTVVSTLVVCNQTSSSVTFRIATRPSAEGSTTTKNWIIYGTTITANDSLTLPIGITLAAGDKIQIFASSANMSFSAYGSEIS